MRSIALLSLFMGCTPDSATPPVADDRPAVRMDDDGFYGSPFPADGRDLSGFPNPDANPFVATMLDYLDPSEGFSTTAAIHFGLTGPITATLPDVHTSVLEDSPVQLIALDTGERHPVDVKLTEADGPFGAPNLLTLLPLQGMPLRPGTTYAAILTTDLGLQPTSLDGPVDRDDLAGFTTFTTWDPTAGLTEGLAVARAAGTPVAAPFVLLEEHPEFCVFESQVDLPVLQEGEPPYTTEGGAWADPPRVVATETSRIFVTTPRTPGPWPVAVMSRTGGGGDRPLIDRGFRPVAGGEAGEAGTGPALHFARAGVAGVTVDGPHGGLRNATGGDEQFLMFNIGNPPAMRDNVRQSALELALMPEIIDGFDLDTSACTAGTLDSSRLALFGHSMGATIAPLVVAEQDRYSLLLLSGAGGSWIENIIHKQLPLEVLPLAELVLGYAQVGRTLDRYDPALSLLQWMGEPADPPVYASQYEGDVLMMQGIVDRYILPPIANATSLSYGLDRLGPALDETTPEVQIHRPLSELQPFVGTGAVVGPVTANQAGATRVVTQHAEGPIEDGHEVVFQTDEPKALYEEALRSWALTGTAEIPSR